MDDITEYFDLLIAPHTLLFLLAAMFLCTGGISLRTAKSASSTINNHRFTKFIWQSCFHFCFFHFCQLFFDKGKNYYATEDCFWGGFVQILPFPLTISNVILMETWLYCIWKSVGLDLLLWSRDYASFWGTGRSRKEPNLAIEQVESSECVVVDEKLTHFKWTQHAVMLKSLVGTVSQFICTQEGHSGPWRWQLDSAEGIPGAQPRWCLTKPPARSCFRS